MSDGKWSGVGTSELLRQNLTRHRLLWTDLGTEVDTIGVIPFDVCVSSFYSALSPNNPALTRTQPAYPYGGPHFVMSPETPDEAHTFGVQICLLNGALNLAVVANQAATPLVGNFTLTLWCLITNTQQPNGTGQPVWASMLPQTNVQFNELYHSFDINASAIRLQVENGSSVARGANSGVIGFAMAEL